MDRPGVRQVPEGSGEQEKMEETGCKIICGAPTTLAVKGLIMMIDRAFPITAHIHLVHSQPVGGSTRDTWTTPCPFWFVPMFNKQEGYKGFKDSDLHSVDCQR